MANTPNVQAIILEKKPDAPVRDNPAVGAEGVMADVAASPEELEKSQSPRYALEQKVSKSWDFLDYADKDKNGVITPAEWKASAKDIGDGKVPGTDLKFPATFRKLDLLSQIFDPNGDKHPWEILAPIDRSKLPEKMEELAYSNADIVALRAKTIQSYKDLRLGAAETEYNVQYMDQSIAWLDINNDAQISREELLDRNIPRVITIDPTKGKDAPVPPPNLNAAERIVAAQKKEADEFAVQAWNLLKPLDINGDGYIQKEEEPKTAAGNESAVKFIADIKQFRAASPDAPINMANAYEVANKTLFTKAQMDDFLKESIDSLKKHIESGEMTKEQASASYKEAAAIVAKLSTADSATYAEMIKNTGGTSLVAKAPLAGALSSVEGKAKE